MQNQKVQKPKTKPIKPVPEETDDDAHADLAKEAEAREVLPKTVLHSTYRGRR